MILKETWLTNSIANDEVIVKNEPYRLLDYNYRNSIIYRNNRSRITHSIDPIDPGKYARYFGGVLIALMYDIKADKKPHLGTEL